MGTGDETSTNLLILALPPALINSSVWAFSRVLLDAIAFTALMIVDFATRLLDAFTAARSSNKNEAPAPELAKAPNIELDSIQVKVADLAWVTNNLPLTEVWAMEMPNAIALAKARFPVSKSQPVVAIATKQQIISVGIRRCKKLASQLKIRRYNVMRLTELADVLYGKVAVGDLVA